MDILSRSERPEELKRIPGCLIAADIVTTDKKFKPVADYLLGRILVVESLDGALALAGKTKNRYTIVTVQGEIIHPGGALTGGSLKRNTGGIVGRRKTLEKLEAEIVRLEGSISAVKGEKTHLEMKIGEEKQKLRLADENIRKVSAHIQELETEIR